MDISDLKTFEAILRLGSMNQAAAELNTVQSNISARMKHLEAELDVALLQRSGRGVTATPAGERLLPYARRMVKLLDDARAAAVDDGTPNGDLVIGALETTTAIRLSPILTSFTQKYPEVRLVLSTGTTAGLVNSVLESTLQGAFVAGPVSHPELDSQAIFTEELMLVTSPFIRSLKQLGQLPQLRTVVFQLGCSYRQRLETYLAGRGMVVAKPLEFGTLDAILSCVAAGIGISLLPKSLVSAHAKSGTIAMHKLPENISLVETLFVSRKDAYLTSALTTFVELARSHHEIRPVAARRSR